MTEDSASIESQLSELWDLANALSVPEFTVSDIEKILDVNRKMAEYMTAAKTTPVRLHNPNNRAAKGKPKLFTPSDVIKLAASHSMAKLGFQMRWSAQMADDVAMRAQGVIDRLDARMNVCLITFPYAETDGDWARIWVCDSQQPSDDDLPDQFIAFDVDRFLTRMFAKFNAIRKGVSVPDYSIPKPVIAPLNSPENDPMGWWTTDANDRAIYHGLSFEETCWLKAVEDAQINQEISRHDISDDDHAKIDALVNRREVASFNARRDDAQSPEKE